MTKSSQAQVAQLIKSYAAKKGVRTTATSESFSMGTSVRVAMDNQPPAVFNDIKDYAAQFQYGHFNSMEDIYESSNRRDDLPQAKFVFVENSFSDDFNQAAYDLLRADMADLQDAPEDYKQAGNTRLNNDWVQGHVWRLLGGDDYWRELSDKFWYDHRPVLIAAAPVVTVGGFSGHIEKHWHTKREFDFFIVVVDQRMEKSLFNDLRNNAKALDGWYSRKWGTTPGGFAFPVEALAETFLISIN